LRHRSRTTRRRDFVLWRFSNAGRMSACRASCQPAFEIAALHVYLTAIIADTTHNISGGKLNRRYLDNLFQDLSTDALAVIRNAAEEMRDHEIWRAS
jgi:hypothetical protein